MEKKMAKPVDHSPDVNKVDVDPTQGNSGPDSHKVDFDPTQGNSGPDSREADVDPAQGNRDTVFDVPPYCSPCNRTQIAIAVIGLVIFGTVVIYCISYEIANTTTPYHRALFFLFSMFCAILLCYLISQCRRFFRKRNHRNRKGRRDTKLPSSKTGRRAKASSKTGRRAKAQRLVTVRPGSNPASSGETSGLLQLAEDEGTGAIAAASEETKRASNTESAQVSEHEEGAQQEFIVSENEDCPSSVKPRGKLDSPPKTASGGQSPKLSPTNKSNTNGATEKTSTETAIQ